MKAILVSAKLKHKKDNNNSAFPEELSRLAETAGIEPAGSVMLKCASWDPATLIGKGQLQRLKIQAIAAKAGALIFNEELTAAQQRNIKAALGALEVISRTGLILSIFSGRAKTREGRLQAKLAKLSYRLTKLAGHGAAMDQQDGIIGSRGIGERKKEYDRRVLKREINNLNNEIESIRKARNLRRSARIGRRLAHIALVGYTNAGKSTLLNYLTKNRHGIYADNRLFATLDTSTKRVFIPNFGNALFTDTVGFISGLPHTLIAAFRATLEEIRFSDLIIHVHDYSSPDVKYQHLAVKHTLNAIGIKNIPIINAFNKADLISNKLYAWSPARLKPYYISAVTGEGIAKLLSHCALALSFNWPEHTEAIALDKTNLLSFLRANCMVVKEKYKNNLLYITFRAPPESYAMLKKRLGR